ncbi:MAG: hypothetical protein IJA95_07470 [Bacteroidaceae bacterium]|nr:hypothetical protein [Bacteroidaceae bacterium]
MFFNIRKRLRKNHHLQMPRQFRIFTAPYRLPVVYDYVAEAPRRETEGCFILFPPTPCISQKQSLALHHY